MGNNTMYHQRVYHQTGVAIVAIALSLMVPTGMALAQGPAKQRLIKEFVEAQGTFCFPGGDTCPPGFLFVEGVRNFIGSSNNTQDTPPQRSAKRKLCASVDYAGLADNKGVSFGTTTDGTVTERTLSDGRAEVTVRLHTKNALTWVIEGRVKENDCDFGTGPLLFGRRLHSSQETPTTPPVDGVLDGGDAALGDSFLQVVFINPVPGHPLPDLIQLFGFPEEGQQLRSFSFYASADGTLRAAFGVPEGTPGRAITAQTGILFRMTPSTAFKVDGFAAEQLILKATGH